jgi:uncharacterized protein involved in response to NO
MPGITIKNLLLEPYRLFFSIGSLYAVLAVGFWFNYLHFLDHEWIHLSWRVAPIQWHAHVMIYGVLGAYIFGFLLTAFPRFVGGTLPSSRLILLLFAQWFGAQFFFMLGTFQHENWLIAAFIFELLSFGSLFLILVSLYWKTGAIKGDRQPLFLLMALLFGGIGAGLAQGYFILGWDYKFYLASIELGVYGFLLLMVVSVTYRVVPFFAGRVEEKYQGRRGKFTLQIISALITLRLFLALGLPDSTMVFLFCRGVDAVLLGTLGWEWLRWRPWQVSKNPMIYLLFLGLSWILFFLGFSAWEGVRFLLTPASAPPPLWQTPALHAFFIGSLGTLLIAIGTRVVRGHGGLPIKPDPFVLIALVLIQLAALWRVFIPFFEVKADSFWVRNYWAGFFWCLAFGIWAIRYIPINLRPRPENSVVKIIGPWLLLPFFLLNFLFLPSSLAQSMPPLPYSGEKPEKIWPDKVKVGGEFRTRIESQINYDFDTSTPDTDTFVLFRTRVYLDINPSEDIRLFAMFQDARTVDQTTALIKPPDQTTLYQGFFFIKNDSPLATHVKIGRQELIYGDQRLIGNFDWNNLGRYFDGMALRLENPDFWLDLFGTRIKPPGKTEQQFAGAYARWKKFPEGELEPYVLVLHGSMAGLNSGELSLVTMGTRLTGKFKKQFDYGFEGAYQAGESDGHRVSAFATHARLGYTFLLKWKPRLGMEYNFASGDQTPGVGTVTTFNNLFPSNHDKYGYMDLFAWKNLHDIRFSFHSWPTSFMSAGLDYHAFFLPNPADGTFLASGAQLRPGSPGASPFAGQELDILFKFKPIKYFDALVGYSVFFPGGFYQDTGPSDIAQFFYTQFTARY